MNQQDVTAISLLGAVLAKAKPEVVRDRYDVQICRVLGLPWFIIDLLIV